MGQALIGQIIEKSKYYLITLFILIVPIFLLATQGDQRIVQEGFFELASMTLFSLYFGNIWVTLFFMLNVVLFAFGGCDIGYKQVINVFLGSLLFVASRHFFKSREKGYVLKLFRLPLMVLVSLTLAFTALQLFSIDPIANFVTHYGEVKPHFSYNQPSGMFFGQVFNGQFLAIASSILIFHTFWIGLVCALMTFMLHSCGAVLAALFVLSFYTYFKFHYARRLFVTLLCVILISGAAYLIYEKHDDSKTFMARFEHWHLVFKKVMERPLGYGPDSFRSINKLKNFHFVSDESYNPALLTAGDPPSFRYHSADNGQWEARFKGKVPSEWPSHWYEAHNDWLQFLFEYGVFGVAILWGFIVEIINRFKASEKDREVLALFACLCAYGIISTVQFPFHLARISGIFGLVLGAYFARTDPNFALSNNGGKEVE